MTALLRADRQVGHRVRLLAAVLVLLAPAWLSGCKASNPLKHTREAPRDVASAVLAAFAAKDQDALQALAVDAEEFRTVVWPRLPAARPERNLTWQYVWRDLSTKSQYHARARLAAWRASGLSIVKVTFAGRTDDYGAYRIHRETLIDVRAPDGTRSTERWFGSMIEQDGRYKVFSYVVD